MVKEILNKIKCKKFKVGIIGLGYVGLPLAISFQQNGIPVVGFDIDEKKIEKLNNGISYISHIGPDVIENISNSKNIMFTTNFSLIADCDSIIMCVPTPLTKNRDPDMSYVISSCKIISKFLKKGQLIVLESTTYPGTMDEIVIPILENKNQYVAGKDFFIAYSPEREDPGNKNFDTATIPKVLGAFSENCLKIAENMYSLAINNLVTVENIKTAEAVKITENIFRAVNIALVNELKIIYSKMGINVNNVLDAADTKPFGFMKFSPGPGLGGHCIPIDPFYLNWKAKQFDISTRFIELAGEINTAMPKFVVDKLSDSLNKIGLSLSKSKVLVIGLAYKPNVDDCRESPSLKIFDLLTLSQTEFNYHDNYIKKVPQREFKNNYSKLSSINLTKSSISYHDAVLILTNHDYIDYDLILKYAKLIIDTRNCFPNIKSNKVIIA